MYVTLKIFSMQQSNYPNFWRILFRFFAWNLKGLNLRLVWQIFLLKSWCKTLTCENKYELSSMKTLLCLTKLKSNFAVLLVSIFLWHHLRVSISFTRLRRKLVPTILHKLKSNICHCPGNLIPLSVSEQCVKLNLFNNLMVIGLSGFQFSLII